MKLEKVLVDGDFEDEPYYRDLYLNLHEAGIDTGRLDTKASYDRNVLIISSQASGSDYALDNQIAFVTYGYYHKGSQCVIEGFDEIDADFLVKMYERFWKIPWKIAVTKRLLIREFAVSDGTDIFPEISSDPEFTEKYIEKMYGFFGFGIWALVLKDTGRIIGRAGLFNSSLCDGLEMGYEIDREFRNRGYAYEACTAVINTAVKMLGQRELYAVADQDNKASACLANKLGFEKCGETDGKTIFRLEISV